MTRQQTEQKIEQELLKRAKAKPEQLFRVVIVHEEGLDFSPLELGEFELLMDNISTIELPGRDVLKLEEVDLIHSVEEDHDVTIQ